MAHADKQKAKAFALFPHVLAGMAVVLEAHVDEVNDWARDFILAPGGHKSWSTPARETAPKPKKLTIRDKILAAMSEHPDWTAKQIAKHIGCPRPSVYAAVSKHGIKLPKAKKGRAHVGPKSAPAAPARYRPVKSFPPKAVKPQPEGTKFYLRSNDGEYLHQSGQVLTTEKTYAWKGAEKQILACRLAFPLAKTMREVVVI